VPRLATCVSRLASSLPPATACALDAGGAVLAEARGLLEYVGPLGPLTERAGVPVPVLGVNAGKRRLAIPWFNARSSTTLPLANRKPPKGRFRRGAEYGRLGTPLSRFDWLNT
jgi:hypothetical protein